MELIRQLLKLTNNAELMSTFKQLVNTWIRYIHDQENCFSTKLKPQREANSAYSRGLITLVLHPKEWIVWTKTPTKCLNEQNRKKIQTNGLLEMMVKIEYISYLRDAFSETKLTYEWKVLNFLNAGLLNVEIVVWNWTSVGLFTEAKLSFATHAPTEY